MGKVPDIIIYDLGRPSLNSLFEATKRSIIEQNQYKEYISRNKYGNLYEDKYDNPIDNNSTILSRYDDIIQLIVGVSVGKSGLGRIFGAHAFIMYNVDPYNPARRWQDDIMLDSSGSYGKGRFREDYTDVIIPSFPKWFPTMIGIDAYRRYFFYGELNSLGEMIKQGNINEMLYTYTFIIEKTLGKNIKTLIRSKSRRNFMACAKEATEVLEQSGLFPGISISGVPLNLKRFLDNYTTHNNNIIDLKEKSSYDLDIYP
jgi:hypothetical protein